MKKNLTYLLRLILFFVAQGLFAQDTLWTRWYDVGYYYGDRGEGVAVDDSNNIIVVGGYYWIIKYTPDGKTDVSPNFVQTTT